jgi:hypothetical protein
MAEVSAKYGQVRDAIRTGDVLLCRGRGLLSGLIALGQRSEWSHVGMFVRPPEPAFPDSVLVWESTTLGKLPDVSTGRIVQGVRLVSASDLVASYPGRLAWRHLDGPRGIDFERGWNIAYQRHHGKRYERRWWHLVRAAVDLGADARRADLSSVFCSELLAATWKHLGVLSRTVNPSEVVPADFAPDGGDVMAGRLTHGYRLGPAVRIAP